MSTKYQRPSGSYTGATGLANRTKYQTDSAAVPKVAISAAKVDGDFNYVVDSLNAVDDAINALVVGGIPDGSLTTAKYADGSVTNVKLGTGITRSKLATGSTNVLLGNDNTGAIAEVTAGTGLTVSSNVLNIANGGLSTVMHADASITTAKIADAQITTAKIVDANVTSAKLATTGVTAASYTSANITVNAQGQITAASNGGPQLLICEDQKASGTAGGTFTSGSFGTRALNTATVNNISGASLASNQISLPAGTYWVSASAPAFYVNVHQTRWQNITDSTTTQLGTVEYCTTSVADSSETRSFINTVFTIASAKTFELQHRCQTSRNTDGLGRAGSFGSGETYAQVVVMKIA